MEKLLIGDVIYRLRKERGITQDALAYIGLANSYMKDKRDLSIVEKYHNLSINIKKAFSSEDDSILPLSFEYLNFAQVYLKFNETEKAIDILHKMLEDIKKHDINETIKFSSTWCFNEIQEGKRTITMNLYENMFKIFESPEFDLIKEKKEFIDIINELKSLANVLKF